MKKPSSTAKAAKTKRAPFVKKIRGIDDRATGTWSDVFQFRHRSGPVRTITVIGDEAADRKKLAGLLLKHGAQLPRDSKAAGDMIAAAIDSEAPEIVRHVARPGWQTRKGAAPWFSLGDVLIGEPNGTVKFAAPLDEKWRGPGGLKRMGTLPDWQIRVGETVKDSPGATLMVSAGFAAPLVRIVEMNSFGFHLHGRSKGGKSTLLTTASSLIGLGREELLPTWNSTNPAFLETGFVFNDLFLPMNEAGALRGKRKHAYEQLREATYAYAEGKDTRRHSSSSAATSTRADSFRGIFATSAEHSMAKYAAMADQSRDDGELCRLIDFPAIVAETNSIFARLPEGVTAAEHTDALRDACRECSGTAFPPYIEYLIKQGPAGAKKLVKAARDEFLAYVKADSLDPVTRHIAKAFAILYAGGRLADQAGVWKWRRTSYLMNMAWCFRRATGAMKPVDLLTAAIDVLRLRLCEPNIVERSEKSGILGPQQAAGYWAMSGGVRNYVVHAPAFKNWFDGDGQVKALLSWLDGRKLLDLGPKARGGGVALEDLNGRGLRWPNGKSVRSFSFEDPFAAPSARVAVRRPPIRILGDD